MARPIDPNLKIQLLAAAEAEFVRHGLESARVDDIVARAGRSKGSFYQYFESKDQVFRDLIENLLARLAAIVERPLVTDEKNPPTRAQFLDLWLARDIDIFTFIAANKAMVRLLLTGGYSVAFAGLMNAFAKRTYEMISDSLFWGKEQRIYRRDFSTHFVAVMIAGAYDRLAREMVESVDKSPNIRFMCVQAQEFVLKGISDS